MPRRKCFVSYHHADQALVNNFCARFGGVGGTFIARSLGTEMSPDIIDSNNPEYVMRCIRERFLADSTVTIVLIGRCTWARRYVDWEIQASLRMGDGELPNGLLGITLPSYPGFSGTYPERLNRNLIPPGSMQRDCYARVVNYPMSLWELEGYIEEAYQRRFTHQNFIVNPRERMLNNRPC